MSPNKSKWRINYAIVYKDANQVPFCRNFVQNLLSNIAITLKIEYAIIEGFPGFSSPEEDNSGTSSEIYMDIVCFRAFKNTEISIKDFRMILDKLFSHSDITFCRSFTVHSILQKHLKDVPFPEEFFRPLAYPYVDYQKGKNTTLCVTEASCQGVLDDLREKSAN